MVKMKVQLVLMYAEQVLGKRLCKHGKIHLLVCWDLSRESKSHYGAKPTRCLRCCGRLLIYVNESIAYSVQSENILQRNIFELTWNVLRSKRGRYCGRCSIYTSLVTAHSSLWAAGISLKTPGLSLERGKYVCLLQNWWRIKRVSIFLRIIRLLWPARIEASQKYY